jgi:DNA-binding NarL/FixJ family response regulator
MGILLKRRIAIIDSNDNFKALFSLLISNSDRYLFVGGLPSSENRDEAISKSKPDIILICEEYSGLNVIEVAKEIKQFSYHIEVIILTTNETPDFIFESLKAGVSGFIPKNTDFPALIYYLDQIQRDQAPLSGRAAKILIDHFYINPNSPLTRRETEIIKMVSQGKSYREISESLLISRETVKTHFRNIHSKLNVNKRSDAIEKALQEKFI